MSAIKVARNACMDSATLQIHRCGFRTFPIFDRCFATLRQGALLLALLLFATGYTTAARADDIDYVYDEAGRLVQATNRTSGEAVRYTYDAVGNITSQISGPTTTLALGHFSPRRGPVGTQVTINGTGFSTTPSSNTVRFNGAVAAVVSSTETKIVASVPESASSGLISVEVGAATVTSAESFVVTSTDDGPSISLVLRNVTRAGNIVTIVGANFEPIPAQNRVRFNFGNGEVLDATETALTVRVPPEAGSGRIRVTTPRGIAISPTDFIVLPSSYTLSSLVSTERMAVDGTSTAVTTAANSKFALRLFEGKLGDLFTVGVSGMTVASAQVHVRAPDNSLIASGTLTPTASGLQVPELTIAGTYSIYVFPSGSGSLELSVLPPTATSLTLGSPVTVDIAPQGRRALFTFAVPADTYADVSLSGVTLTKGTAVLTGPDGALVKSQSFTNTGMSLRPWLKQAGQYTLLIDPTGSLGGALTVNVNTSDTPTFGSGPFDQQTLSISTATPTVFTFRAQANEYLSVLTEITNGGTGFGVSLTVKMPDGTQLAQRSVGTSYGTTSKTGSGVLNFGPVSMAGTYTLTLQRSSGSSGALRVTLTRAALYSGLPGGGQVLAGQTLITSFNGARGEFVSMSIAEIDGFMRGGTAVVLKPDGSRLMSQNFTIRTGQGSLGSLPGGGSSDYYRDGSAVVNMGPLPMSGTYRFLVQQGDHARESDAYTGAWVLTRTNPVPSGITIDGPLAHTRFEVNGQGVLYSFTGSAGQLLALGMRTDTGDPSHPNTMDAMNVAVFDADGNQVATGGMTVLHGTGMTVPGGFGSGVVNIGPLPASGVYRIFMQNLGYWRESTGGIEAYLSTPIGTAFGAGGETEAETARMGQGALVTFTASAGDYRGIRIETHGHDADAMSSRLRVFSPDGSQLGETSNVGQESQSIGYSLFTLGPLPAAGTYTAVVEQTGQLAPNIGTFKISVTQPRTGTFSGNGSVGVDLGPGQPLQYNFTATKGSYRSLVVSQTDGAINSAHVDILQPDGTLVLGYNVYMSGSPLLSGRGLMNVGPLPVTGDYSIVVRQTQRRRLEPLNPGPLILTLATPAESTVSTTVIGLQGQGALRTFTGTAGQTVSVQVVESDGGISQAAIKLLSPAGTTLSSGSMYATRCSDCAGYGGSRILGGVQLPATGTYSVLVQQASLAADASGMGVLTIDVPGTDPTAGGTTNIATTTAGQYGMVSHTVAAGESFSVAMTSAATVPASATAYSLYVLRPEGTVYASASCSTANSGCQLSTRDAPVAGTYQIQVRPASSATISGVLTVAPAVTGDLTLDTPLPLSMGEIGQTAFLGFMTAARQTLTLGFDSVTTTRPNTKLDVTVATAAGTLVRHLELPAGRTINMQELGPNAYYVWIRPQYPTTTSMQVTLRSPVGGATSDDGTAVTFSTEKPGEGAFYTFEAQAGESVGVAVTDLVITPSSAGVSLYVYAPDGSSLNHMGCGAPRCLMPLYKLAQSGTYRVAFEPRADATLSGALTISKALTGSLTVGQPVTLNLGIGQPAVYSMAGTAGRPIALSIFDLSTTPSKGVIKFVVMDSRGNTKLSGSTQSGSTFQLPELPQDNYFLWLTQSSPMIASMRVDLSSAPRVMTDGSPTNFDPAGKGKDSNFTFDAQAGDSIGVALTNLVATPATTAVQGQLYVYPPGSGSYLSFGNCQSNCSLSFRNLPATGSYRVVFSPSSTLSVAGTLTVSKALAGTLSPDQPVALSLSAPGQPALYRFIATQGQHLSVNLGALAVLPSGSGVNVAVYDSLGNVEASGTAATGLSLELPALPADTYFVWLTQPSPMTGEMQMRLGSVPLQPTDGTTTDFNTGALGQSSYYAFNAQAGQSVGLALTNIVSTPAGQGARISLYHPGSTSAANTLNCPAPSCVLSVRNLPQTGTYRVVLASAQASRTVAGSIAISEAVAASLSAGTPYALNLTQPGQPAVLSFTQATAGPLSMSIGSISSTPSGTSYNAVLYNSSNGQVTSAASSSSMTLTSTNLPAGSYIVWIYPSATSTASTASMSVSF